MNSESEKKSAEDFRIRMAICAERAGNANKLAQESDVSRRAIGAYLAGDSEPNRSRLLAIAKAAGVDETWLLNGKGGIEPAESLDRFSGEALDIEVLKEVAVSVEKSLIKRNAQKLLGPDRKADLLVTAYLVVKNRKSQNADDTADLIEEIIPE